MAVNGYRCLLTDAPFRRAEILRLITWLSVAYIFGVLFSVSVFFLVCRPEYFMLPVMVGRYMITGKDSGITEIILNNNTDIPEY
ncbi:hypothetical protein H8B49_003825 [Salmonella enterica]|nr:hypothetical protein [Salmonella enterica]